MLSDHHILLMCIDMKKLPHPVKYITHKETKKFNINQIKNDIMKLNKTLGEITDQMN